MEVDVQEGPAKGWTWAETPKVDTAAKNPDGSPALAMVAGAKAVPAAVRLAEEVATNPNLPRGAATAGRVVGAVEGALKGGPLAIGPGSWAGGKGGWFSGKAIQSASAPVAKVLEKVAPYAQAVSTAAGAQGALDLAQMAEPNRKDIGFLGITGDTPDPNHPALLNLLAMKAGDGIKYLISQGLSLGDASRTYWNLKAKAAK